ncbi:hypothetical protein [Paraburkholderia sp. JHI869]|uniref:hypothetical protein n=1 Tax=Paraburkholderia sp. JHI869 TaxID=3112959 RepID=UPI0031747425
MRVVSLFVSEHWFSIVVAGAVLCVLYASVQFIALRRRGPKDATGNGIIVGNAKAFDNRSLQLRIERLSASLSALKTVNQNITDSLSLMQGDTSSDTLHSLAVGLNAKETAEHTETSSKTSSKSSKEKQETKPESRNSEPNEDKKIDVGLAASDLLGSQLNLASQIMNLELLYERSLTDRMFDNGTRIQTVLGFQVSVNPQAGDENCVAIVEVGVRVPENNDSISLVALIPQERTYNTLLVNTKTYSLGGSAVAKLLKIGAGSRHRFRQLHVHRDSDTIAFERGQDTVPRFFPPHQPSSIFGWEFRPVLGASCVTAGIRQMLAVVAIPKKDVTQPGEVLLQIRTRTYWRRYNRRTLASRPRWRFLPWKVDDSKVVLGEPQNLAIPNTAKTQSNLAPTINKIRWVHSGPDQATVIVEGTNFFSGTKVTVGGKTFSEEQSTLTLKSEQALEFTTAIASLSIGDAVLNGRFGPSFRLEVPPGSRPMQGFYIARASIRPSRYTRKFRVAIDVKCPNTDADGQPVDLTTKLFVNMPDPMLLVGDETVPPPYDYENLTSETDPANPNQPISTGKFIRVGAWISAKTLAINPSITFTAPFCGSEFIASFPLSFSEPSVSRLGGDEMKSVFRIAHPLGFATSISVDLDKTYTTEPELKKSSAVDYRFEIDTAIARKYQNIIIRIGTAEPYLLPMPIEPTPPLHPVIVNDFKPPRIISLSRGPVEWSGTDLNGIVSVALYPPDSQSAQPAMAGQDLPGGIPADFAVYDLNKRIEVFFSERSTANPGKATVAFTTASGTVIKVPMHVLPDDSPKKSA